MNIKLLFSLFLNEIKAKEQLSNDKLANYLGCSLSSVSLYLTNKSLVGFDKINSLKNALQEIEYKDIYDYIFNYFPIGYYHGSRQGIIGEIDPFINKNKTLDFGYGFYLGTSFKQSATFVASEDEGKDRVYKCTFSLDGLSVLELRDIRWVLFVAYNRKKIPNTKENAKLIKQIQKVIDQNYDVIVGPIADDRMMISMENFFNNQITYDQLISCLTQLSIGDQYCLKTKKACDNLKIEITYSCFDNGLRSLIRDYAFTSTQAAVKHAEAINKQTDLGKKFTDLVKEYGKKPLF